MPFEAAAVLRDENEVPSERPPQAVWQHQHLRRDRLATVDGKMVRVLHPGFIRVEGGPDFRGAIIRAGDDPPRSGDGEMDLRSASRSTQGHDRNPQFKNVIRHFAWDGAGAPVPSGRHRLLVAGNTDGLHTAAAQQGLLRIVRDVCEHSNAACEHCRLPELVRVWRAGSPT